LNWSIWARAEARYVGFVQATLLPDRSALIAYRLVRDTWGKGYAREAATAVMRHSRKQLGLDKLLAIVTPSNERSCRLLEALGFVLEGEYRAGADAQALKLYAVAFRN
jgi:RimJ/RimL family protein N-acetyltransferase